MAQPLYNVTPKNDAKNHLTIGKTNSSIGSGAVAVGFFIGTARREERDARLARAPPQQTIRHVEEKTKCIAKRSYVLGSYCSQRRDFFCVKQLP
jgi:hypothetical protein